MKKYLNNKEERLDIHFRDNFENFEDTPKHDVWENIEAGIDIEGFDKIFNNKLTDNEQTPSPEVWEKVQAGIPLNLFVKKHLENLMKIAAVLLCFMSLTLYLTVDKNKTTEMAVLDEAIILKQDPLKSTSNAISTIEAVEKEDFVYEIKKKKSKKRTKKTKKEQDADSDAEALWKLLMEDDEEFADVMDEDTKLKILSPPVRLPLIEETVAMLDNANEPESVMEITLSEIPEDLLNEETITETETIEPDLKIWVPLVVVEKHEIEKLIHLYDQAEASKKNNSLSNQ